VAPVGAVTPTRAIFGAFGRSSGPASWVSSHHPARILAVMTPMPSRRRHLSSSPFQADPEPVIEQFEFGDTVSHDSYGVGRVVGTDVDSVTVDFRTQTVRVTSPYSKMTKL
jgi:hypothetical protein